jgi:hypothetical protein
MADKPVSNDLAKALEHLAGVPKDKVDEARKEMEKHLKGAVYRYCTWWGG